jgi:Spy/CpxP family protein refolding chaperone
MNSQKKAWLAFLIVFALGGVTGASLAGIYRLRAETPASSQTASISMRDTDAYFEMLMRELTLNDDQSSAMRAILDRTRDDYKAVCADVRPRYDVVRDRARNQMRVLLTPDQQQRFDSIVTAQDCRCPEPKK